MCCPIEQGMKTKKPTRKNKPVCTTRFGHMKSIVYQSTQVASGGLFGNRLTPIILLFKSDRIPLMG